MRGRRFGDINDPYLAPPWRDPPEPPEFRREEIRRLTACDGEELVLVRDQDGDEFVVNADEFDHPEEREL